MCLPICPYITGPLARIVKYVRSNNRCPVDDDFLSNLDHKMSKKFAGQCDAITKQGESYQNRERFTPLHEDGKPLWEFKGFDHRLYCFRKVIPPNAVVLVLFSGWVKQKRGKSKKEDREIQRAKRIYEEFMKEYPGGNV